MYALIVGIVIAIAIQLTIAVAIHTHYKRKFNARTKEIEKEYKSKLKSSEVQRGYKIETLIPFMSSFPYDTRALHYFGNPIDFVGLTYDGQDIVVRFLEIKSGQSKLSKIQRQIRDAVINKRVTFEVLTYKSDDNIMLAIYKSGAKKPNKVKL